nr:hypothetical protein [uncultured Desulfuromonas sp.]
MAVDILDPVDLYRTVLKEAHARNVSEFFEDLVRRSGVDERTNVKTVAEVRILEVQIKKGISSSRWWRILRGTIVLAAFICSIMAFAHRADRVIAIGSVVGALTGIVLTRWQLNPRIGSINEHIANLKAQLDERLQEAWKQVAPLNQLYHWGMFAELVRQTVPRIELDPYFSNGRLNELRNSFGWTDLFNQDSSLMFSHSGELNGNPLIIGRKLNHRLGTKTYTGTLTIHWTETEKDTDGRSRTVSKSETLRATVDKPFPVFLEDAFVIYGNEAAPNLSFTREPSDLSGLDDGIINDWLKAWATKKLEAKSRSMKSGFTIMSNSEFDTLFGATDRDHEVQFRLLFTALAQQEIVKLLKDKTVGYGDDFAFTKAKMINLVRPFHMGDTDISSDPTKFHAYELEYARKIFNEYQNDLFKSVFFGIAPLLTIPLYQQHRSHADIYRDVYERSSSFWEHESIANYFGENRFQHPKCITRSILKTHVKSHSDGMHVVRVSASGYSSINRVDYVSVLGGDGTYHRVPVKWVQYIGVSHDSEMVLLDRAHFGASAESPTTDDDWQEAFQRYGVDPKQAVLRRSIIAALR